MAKTEVTMVRHGETEWNVAMRLQGMQNSHLTSRGVEQAQQAAKALQHRSFDRLISSDLERALDTAKILNQYHDLSIDLDPALRERNFGIMEGLTREQILQKYPETFSGYMERKDTYQIPDGESLVSFFGRVSQGINTIVRNNAGKKILVVTHGGVMDCMMRMIFEIPLTAPRRFSIFNASINEFSCEGSDWQLETWGRIDFQETGSKSIDEPKD